MQQKPTKAIHTQHSRSHNREHSVPMFLTSSFCYDDAEQMRAVFADEEDAFVYSRFSNPNVQEFTDKMAALEGAEAGYATASGMSAIFSTFMCFLKTGDHLLSSRAIFGSTIPYSKNTLATLELNIPISMHPPLQQNGQLPSGQIQK